MQHSFRDLIYVGDGWGQALFASESDSPRLNGRGGLGDITNISLEENLPPHCNCPEYQRTMGEQGLNGECWHVTEAPKALAYWTARLNLGDMQNPEFDALWSTWWPRRLPIDLRCEEQGSYKGKSREDWALWYMALRDEYEARIVARRNLERSTTEDFIRTFFGPDAVKGQDTFWRETPKEGGGE